MAGELWITYTPHYGRHVGPEMDPTTYTGVAIFDTEIEALRYANRTSTKAILIRPGQTLEDAIKQTHRRVLS